MTTNDNGGGGGGTDNGGGGGGGSGGDKPWFDGVDAETLGYLQNRGLDKGDARSAALAAIASHRNAEKVIGAPANEVIRLPKDPNDKAWNDIRVRLGAGKEPKDYDFVDVKFADGKGFEDKFADFLKTTFHREGIPVKAGVSLAREFAKYIDNMATDNSADLAANLAKERDTLQKNWGNNFRQNMVVAENAAKKFGIPDEVLETLKGINGMGHAAVLETLLKIGQATGEDRFINSDGNKDRVVTIEAARERLAELKRDRSWVDRFNANDLTAVKEFNNLTSIIAGH